MRSKNDPLSRPYYQADDFAVVDRITEVARKRGVSNAQIALAWVLHQPGITSPIIGASKLAQLDELVAALDVKLDADEIHSLSELYQPHSIIGHS